MLGYMAQSWRAGLERIRVFANDQRGASIVFIALTMPALIGAMGLAAEVSYWNLHRRAMQNAADAAVIAAATNGGPSYAAEGQAVAAQYGFQNGSGNVLVNLTNPAAAAGCASGCYVAKISDTVPTFLSQVAGFGGNSSAAHPGMTTLSATAVASSIVSKQYCVLALASSGAQGITSNGAPKASLNGCNLMSNTGATCHGSNLHATSGDAHGVSAGCGNVQNSNVPVVSDPYARLATNIRPDTCGSYYPQEPSKHGNNPLPATNQLVGTYSGFNHVACGDQQLVGDTTINNATLVIENGALDTNGYTLSGTDLTIVFTGSNASTYQHAPIGGGTLNFAAPTSGAWSGVAIYQDPNLTTNVDISAAGNSPTWNISGLVYLPHSSVTFSGAVNKSNTGSNCFTLVVDNITINGTGSIFANNSQCAAAGLTQPGGGHRGTMVN
jgi:Flp pilus assembly protein TadG